MSTVLHLYKLTRFSTAGICESHAGSVLHLYKLTRFSTTLFAHGKLLKFYTSTNLQGSQPD